MNGGIINSVTKLHLVGCFYWIRYVVSGQRSNMANFCWTGVFRKLCVIIVDTSLSVHCRWSHWLYEWSSWSVWLTDDTTRIMACPVSRFKYSELVFLGHTKISSVCGISAIATKTSRVHSAVTALFFKKQQICCVSGTIFGRWDAKVEAGCLWNESYSYRTAGKGIAGFCLCVPVHIHDKN